jgi:hypothetical protein
MVRAPDFADLFAKRVQVFGRTLLVAEKDANGSMTLRHYDIPTGADVWKARYRPKSIVMQSEDPSLAGVVEPDGKVHIVDLRARKEVMTGQMDKDNVAEHLRNVQSIHLLADREHFYLACQAEMDINNRNRGDDAVMEANVMTQLGMRSVSVNGYLYAFERGSGDVYWFTSAKNQFLILDQFSDLPVVFLTARSHGLREWVPKVSVVIVEKQGGRTVFDLKDLKREKPFYAVRIHPESGTIDFVSPTLKITARSAGTGK